jgi:hypothetical protein
MFGCGYGREILKFGLLVGGKLVFCGNTGDGHRAALCWQKEGQCQEDCVLFGGNKETKFFDCGGKETAKNWLYDFEHKEEQIEDEKKENKRKAKDIDRLSAELLNTRVEKDKLKFELSQIKRKLEGPEKPRKVREKKEKA